MAPNLKRISVLSQSLSGLQVTRPKDSAFQPPQPPIDSDSYWEWPTESVNLFSVSHIESNLVQTAASKSEPPKTLESSDDYWAERDQDEVSTSSPLHGQEVPIDSDTYWSTSNTKTESDNYWTFETAATGNDGLWSWSHKHTCKNEKKEEQQARTLAAQEESRDQAKAYWKSAHDNGETDPYFGWTTQQIHSA